jgi:Stage II sporulation protein E (SpoIIE)
VGGLLSGPSRRLGYAYVVPGGSGRFVVYAERTVPTNKRSKIASTSAFVDLDYALYLGPAARASELLLASSSRVPLSGRRAAVTVPFGDSHLTLVMKPRRALAGSLPQRLPWIIGIVGTILAVSLALISSRLIQRRRGAELLAERLEAAASENRRLYSEQRTIAQTLQHALLPDALPEVRGIEASAVYAAGEQGVDVGGDWYDLIALDDQRVMLVVGDVSGRGLRAASTMAALRFAIQAYAAQHDTPSAILTKLSSLMSVNETGQLATVLCLLVDVDARTVTMSSAGHLPPLLITSEDTEYLRSEVGLPIGIDPAASYTSTTTVPGAARLLAFTDGLVERRGENLDQGMARLRAAAQGRDGDLAQ